VATVRVERLIDEARIPKRYEHCDLDSYLPNHESQKRAKIYVQRFLEKYPQIDVGLLFLGTCGVGKTHLAVALLKQVIVEKGDAGLFYDFRDLLREIQASWNSVSQASELDVLRPVLEAKVLVLDELGAKTDRMGTRYHCAHHQLPVQRQEAYDIHFELSGYARQTRGGELDRQDRRAPALPPVRNVQRS
jgi:DNA replication protein DnaC